MLGGDGCFSTPGHFFLNINCLMWCKGHSSVPVSSTPCKLAVINVQGRKCLCFILLFHRVYSFYVSPFIFHKFNVKLAYFIVSISTAV